MEVHVAPAHRTSLYLVRHAEVETQYHRVFAGARIDAGLSDLGQEQAVRVANFLKGICFDAIYASPMKRVQQTLAPLLLHKPTQPVSMKLLREVDFGDWTGLSWDQVMEKFSFSPFEWLDGLERGTIPNAESMDDFQERIQEALRIILCENQGRTVAVYCHGGVIRMFMSILLNLPLSRMSMFEIDYASVTHVQHRTGKTEVKMLNFAPWQHPA